MDIIPLVFGIGRRGNLMDYTLTSLDHLYVLKRGTTSSSRYPASEEPVPSVNLAVSQASLENPFFSHREMPAGSNEIPEEPDPAWGTYPGIRLKFPIVPGGLAAAPVNKSEAVFDELATIPMSTEAEVCASVRTTNVAALIING